MEAAIRSLRVSFSLHRTQIGNSAVPSEFNDELMTVIKASLSYGDAKFFLRQFGILLFENCCAFNMNLLSESISSSRSRLLKALRREKWNPYTGDVPGVKNLLRSIVGDSEIRNWSLREYPKDRKIEEYINKNGILVYETEKRDLSSLVVHEPIELTLQKDIYSCTLFDDA